MVARKEFTMLHLTAVVCALMFVPLTANAAPRQPAFESGIASIDSGTSSGKRQTALQSLQLTAAHRTLPFGTLVKVTNLRNGQWVVVRINDRGPFIGGRIIDLSPGAGRALGISGIAPVTVAVVP
jgi:rare lipoprotein A